MNRYSPSLPDRRVRRRAELTLLVLPLLLVAAALAVTAPLAAQQQPVAWPIVPVHTRSDPIDGSYGLWAAGADYKASFDDGVTFVPYLGVDRARNETWRWRTLSVAFGAERPPLRTRPARAASPTRVEIAHGVVVEAYDVRREGLEQTFVVSHVPAAGDLVIRGRVDGSLHVAAREAGAQALTFAGDAGDVRVGYGAATAFDAEGRSRAMTTRVEGDVVELHLDGAWLAQAALPVVVDPLIRLQAVGAFDVVASDAVRDPFATSGEALYVAYERAASALDSDLWFVRFADDGASQVLAYADLAATWSTREPSVAFVGHARTAIAAWTHESAAGRRSVRWIGRGQHYIPELVVPAPNGANDWRPDVGGAGDGAPDDWGLIVFQRELNGGVFAPTEASLVIGQPIDAAAHSSGSAMSGQAILAGGGYDNERPCINQDGEGSADHAWLVAWQRFSPSPLPNVTWRIAMQKVGRWGLVTPPSLTPSLVGRHDMGPSVAGENGRYLVAWSSVDAAPVAAKPALPNGNRIVGFRVDWPGLSPWPSYPHGEHALHAAVGDSLAVTGVSFDEGSASHWLVATRDDVSQACDVVTAGYTGAAIERASVLAGGGAASSARAAITYDEANSRHVMATGSATGSGGGTLSLAALGLPATPPPSVSEPDCSPAAIGWTGSQVAGSEFGRVLVVGAAPDALHVVLVASGAVSLPVGGVGPFVPGCTLMVATQGPQFLGVLPPAIGAVAQWQLPLPAAMPAVDLRLQGVHTVGGVGAMASTARLTVPVRR